MDVAEHNRRAWNRLVEGRNQWTVPVSSEQIQAAREGRWALVLTPTLPVPREWFGELAGARVLCLASGGGQQAPILAAAGATVTVLDNCPKQLAQDRLVADRDGLQLRIEQGLMQDLSRFDDGAFDLVFHPVSNVFVPQVRPVWKEAFRVLRPGGTLLSGFNNPALYLFDEEEELRGELVVRHKIPYSDLDLPKEKLDARIARGEPLEFGHTLDDQIGGQIAVGFVITGFFEDRHPPSPLAEHLPCFIATRALKPAQGAVSA